jgi:hypothetical protein
MIACRKFILLSGKAGWRAEFVILLKLTPGWSMRREEPCRLAP